MESYQILLQLKNEAFLNMTLFDSGEHIWTFKNRYRVWREDSKKMDIPTLINDTSLVVNYNKGLVKKCELFMGIQRLDKKGKYFFAGTDISDQSELNIGFFYEKKEDNFRLKEIKINSQKIDLSGKSEGLVKQIDIPFPIEDCLTNKHGIYRVPFLREENINSFFEFPEEYSHIPSKPILPQTNLIGTSIN